MQQDEPKVLPLFSIPLYKGKVKIEEAGDDDVANTDDDDFTDDR